MAVDAKELRRMRFEIVVALLAEDPKLADQIREHMAWGTG
jgi:hypothetical protein